MFVCVSVELDGSEKCPTREGLKQEKQEQRSDKEEEQGKEEELWFMEAFNSLLVLV